MYKPLASALLPCVLFSGDAPRPDRDEPPVWFHDVFRPDGTPYSASKVAFPKSVTAR